MEIGLNESDEAEPEITGAWESAGTVAETDRTTVFTTGTELIKPLPTILG